jgi:Protein of unknown function (DUF3040)
MALSMEEQRILAEIEHQLAGDDPSLAARLTTFGRPGLAASLRTPRGRVLVSFLTVAVVALLSLMVYSLVPFRALSVRGTHVLPAATASHSGQAARSSQPASAGAAANVGAAGTTGAAGSAAADAPAAAKAAAAGQATAADRSGGDFTAARPPAGQAASPRQAPSG